MQFKIQTSNPTFGHTQIYGDLQQIAQQENQKIDFKIYTEKSPSKAALLSKRDFLAKELIDINWILEDLAIFEPQLKLSSFKNRGANKNLDIEA